MLPWGRQGYGKTVLESHQWGGLQLYHWDLLLSLPCHIFLHKIVSQREIPVALRQTRTGKTVLESHQWGGLQLYHWGLLLSLPCHKNQELSRIPPWQKFYITKMTADWEVRLSTSSIVLLQDSLFLIPENKNKFSSLKDLFSLRFKMRVTSNQNGTSKENFYL